MNTHLPMDEREWLAQQRAMHGGGSGSGIAPVDDDDAMVAAYRAVAAAARHAPPPDLPAGFAAQVAALARADARATLPDIGFERVLLRMLLALMPVALAAVLVLFGARWWQASIALLGEDALRWAAVAATCAALSWGIERLRGDGARAGGAGTGGGERAAA